MSTATQIFEHLRRQASCTVERIEIGDTEVDTVRSHVRSILARLAEDEASDAIEITGRLRSSLSELLTVPVPFDHSLIDNLHALGSPPTVEARWGREVGFAAEQAATAAARLAALENPMRTVLREELTAATRSGDNFRIYCHRRARPHFESLVDPSAGLADVHFIHSVRDYAASDPFGILFKVGPLRSRGWGSAPDALLAAPRFEVLRQIVWRGSSDEAGFGYDPAAVAGDSGRPVGSEGVRSSGVQWISRSVYRGNSAGPSPAPLSDDFQFFSTLRQEQSLRRCVLVQIDGEHGILYPQHAPVLTFDPHAGADHELDRRAAGQITPGMYVVQAALSERNSSGVRARHGDYSRHWKVRLDVERSRDMPGLVRRLRASGLNLIRLENAVNHWCVEPTTVIHAPQQGRHFEILARVLGLDFSEVGAPSQAQGIVRAWNEVRASRGEAIQSGMQEHEVIEQRLADSFRGLSRVILDHVSAGSGFTLPIPEGLSLEGRAMFHRIITVETGFLAPDHALRVVSELNAFEQWRS